MLPIEKDHLKCSAAPTWQRSIWKFFFMFLHEQNLSWSSERLFPLLRTAPILPLITPVTFNKIITTKDKDRLRPTSSTWLRRPASRSPTLGPAARKAFQLFSLRNMQNGCLAGRNHLHPWQMFLHQVADLPPLRRPAWGRRCLQHLLALHLFSQLLFTCKICIFWDLTLPT